MHFALLGASFLVDILLVSHIIINTLTLAGVQFHSNVGAQVVRSGVVCKYLE